jgi:low affinity Fe/Cu permease
MLRRERPPLWRPFLLKSRRNDSCARFLSRSRIHAAAKSATALRIMATRPSLSRLFSFTMRRAQAQGLTRRNPAWDVPFGSMQVFIRRCFTTLGTMTASPWSLAIVAGYTVLWFAFEPSTLDFHGFATVATWCMTLFIQRSEHRDTQAIQAKLDELLKAQPGARSDLASIDRREPEDIEKHRLGSAL